MKLINATFEDRFFEFSTGEKDSSTRQDPLITVLIGPNASGKSRCLSNIANAFRRINDARSGRTFKVNFSIRYLINNQLMEISFSNREKKEHLTLPNKVISISNSLFDKFPTKARVADQNFYEYVGARDSGLDMERYSIYSLIDTIQDNCKDEGFVEKAKTVMEYLDLEPKITIQLKTTRSEESEIYKALFQKRISSKELTKLLLETQRFGKLSKEQQSTIQRNFKNDKYLKGLKSFIHTNATNIIEQSDKELSPFNINLDYQEALKGFYEDYKYFSLLRKLNVVSYNRILVKRKGAIGAYDILQSSSGEVNFLTSFIRVIPSLSDNSLILIDEPEISLHPNWQLQYIEKIKELLLGYKGCHVIIATHSPYIVADTNPDNCWVSQYSIENSLQSSELLPTTPYGWSVENILYNVFNVSTYRNYYLEMDVRNLLLLLSKKSKNKKKIQELISKLEKFNIEDDDPLAVIIENAKKYLIKL